jgi:RNA polymerase sigma-70 factor (ECF subfamily)
MRFTPERGAAAAGGYACPAELLRDHAVRHNVDPDCLPPELRADLGLAAGCAAGAEAAWDVFVRTYQPFLHHVALRLTRNPTEAEDLAAHIVAALLEGKIAQYAGRGNLRGWLRAVAVHLFLDRRRQQQRHRLESLPDNLGLPAPETEGEEGCEKHFHRPLLEEIAAELAGALGRLPLREAAFLNLYYFQGLTLAQAAAQFGVHESTASRWNDRLLERIGRQLRGLLLRRKGWSRADLAAFLDLCLGYLAGRLEKVRRNLAGDFSRKPDGDRRLVDEGNDGSDRIPSNPGTEPRPPAAADREDDDEE